jgi:lysophospholipase L1-like esterase
MNAQKSPPPRGAKSALFFLATLSIGGALAFGVGEAAFRALGIRPQEAGRVFRISDGPDLQFPGRARHRTIDLYNTNPRGTFPVDLRNSTTRARLTEQGFRRIDEALPSNPFGVPFTYNSRGFREREFTPKAAGTRRIVFVGDSFTEGMGVVEEASVVRLVEQLLRRREDHVEVFNLGVRRLDFPELESLFDTAFELTPDVIVFQMVLNDGERSASLSGRWPRVNDWIMVRRDPPSFVERHSLLASFVAQRYERMRVSWDTTAWYSAIYSDENRDGWMRTRAALRRIQNACERRGISFGVALWPLMVGLETQDSYPFQGAHAQIRTGVERTGIPFLDLWPILRGHSSESLWVHPSDLHPNELAQSLVAPALAGFVRARLENPENAGVVAK